MVKPNMYYNELKDSYLFYNIAQKTRMYVENHPGVKLLRMGIGDVSLPLCDAVIKALHEAVDDQASKSSFHGYMPECGAPFLREAIVKYYAKRGISLSAEEIFVSSGASDELGDVLDLFDRSNQVLVIEPAYPAYVDANVMAGRKIMYLVSGEENEFLPEPNEKTEADIIYICSPNNPTGAVFSRSQLQAWVNYANKRGSIILFDAAYEAFIEDEILPHSIFELDGAETCAIEICSFSKTAGFTGTRLGYTIIPKALKRNGMNMNEMWVRNRTTKTNGVSYIIQKGGAAVFSEEGQKQIHENIQIYKKNAKVLMQALDQLGIWYCGGKNAPYIWMKCPRGMKSWEFFDYLLQEIQVVGTPGEGFGACGEGYFRFSTFSSPEDTKEAAKRIVKLLS
ncbi:LL-diaminopimelate aminotransferase [Lachnospiraceae bacterium AM25-11LB]|nr:LL-diaminopimelate aminotransferase [Lachnospiraceae bacterium AM25-22]RGD08386.1 LL-diaminopimelate aminotransferase [Lachnospiraceae bacterium AM25-11LB]RJW12181.1 LL-diaminopimelate aminotransferase [Lachnospiraceae bacterium AM25-40]RJW16136.1 LL-diaminopimelate aminotransferase [Lachnospiraceae bacterium AM25-39]